MNVIFIRLGMYRDAEKQLKSSLKQQDHVDTYLYLCKVYCRLDQPLTAIEVFKQGLEKFQGETTLMTGIARIYEVCFACKKFMNNCVTVESSLYVGDQCSWFSWVTLADKSTSLQTFIKIFPNCLPMKSCPKKPWKKLATHEHCPPRKKMIP